MREDAVSRRVRRACTSRELIIAFISTGDVYTELPNEHHPASADPVRVRGALERTLSFLCSKPARRVEHTELRQTRVSSRPLDGVVSAPRG